MATNTTIKSFTDIIAWQKSHVLTVAVYKLTKQFPKGEMFGITLQLRRACVSITSNIAEGFGRGSIKEKTHFYKIALGSILEVQNQLLIARDVGYLSRDDFHRLAALATEASKLTQGLKKANKRKELALESRI